VQILREYGYLDEEIHAWQARGVVGSERPPAPRIAAG
jgi:hypothetical protein